MAEADLTEEKLFARRDEEALTRRRLEIQTFNVVRGAALFVVGELRGRPMRDMSGFLGRVTGVHVYEVNGGLRELQENRQEIILDEDYVRRLAPGSEAAQKNADVKEVDVMNGRVSSEALAAAVQGQLELEAFVAKTYAQQRKLFDQALLSTMADPSTVQ